MVKILDYDMIHFVSSSCILSSDRQLAVKKPYLSQKHVSLRGHPREEDGFLPPLHDPSYSSGGPKHHLLSGQPEM